ncbi:MAG: NAD(P)-dependent oxidoreductase [Candidatus Thermoplasmatota archaeon]|nr:NAD(P)-dependent oxidoreductase [Candidatus Thermoplasmatota archaeon]
MNRKILVTGGNGFIGSHVVRKLLQTGDKPILITRKLSDMWRLSDVLNQIKTFNVDEQPLNEIFETEMLNGVINLATYYRKQNSFDDIARMIDSNVKFPSQILQLCKEHDVPIFITAGSFFQYRANYSLFSTDNAIARDFYAATKNALSKIMDYYSSSKDLVTIELILFTPYGEKDHDEKLIPFLIRNALNGSSVNLSGGFQKLNLVYIEDVASAFVNALEALSNDTRNARINIGSSRYYSIRDIVTVLEEILGMRISVKWNSVPTSYVDNDNEINVDTKIPELILKWKPKYDIYDGLRKTIDYYRGVMDAS